jgi:hypothetical protein
MTSENAYSFVYFYFKKIQSTSLHWISSSQNKLLNIRSEISSQIKYQFNITQIHLVKGKLDYTKLMK